MILMLHIILGLATVILGIAAMVVGRKVYLQYQLAGFIATIASGAVIVLLQPKALTHLCISGTLFSVVSIALYFAGKRAVALNQLS